MKTELTEKLEAIVELVDNVIVDPDIDLEYCMPEIANTSDSCGVSGNPYIVVKYADDKYVERKIRLTDKYLKKSAQEVANLVIFSAEQFKEEMSAIRYDQD